MPKYFISYSGITTRNKSIRGNFELTVHSPIVNNKDIGMIEAAIIKKEKNLTLNKVVVINFIRYPEEDYPF